MVVHNPLVRHSLRGWHGVPLDCHDEHDSILRARKKRPVLRVVPTCVRKLQLSTLLLATPAPHALPAASPSVVRHLGKTKRRMGAFSC